MAPSVMRALEWMRGPAGTGLEIISRTIDDATAGIGDLHPVAHALLLDHIALAVQRISAGESIDNPLGEQIALLYPTELDTARGIVDTLNSQLSLDIPDGEAGIHRPAPERREHRRRRAPPLHLAHALAAAMQTVSEGLGDAPAEMRADVTRELTALAARVRHGSPRPTLLAAPIRDLPPPHVHALARRVLAQLRGLPAPGVPDLVEPSIVVAADLAPAETAVLDPQLVRGIVISGGGPTSHTALLADVHGPGRTADGHPVALLANIGSVTEAEALTGADVQGVGLMRTEFLFLDRTDAPSEDEQAEAYTRMLRSLGDRRLVVRTLDAGADKPLAFADLGQEENPALGKRGLRFSRARTDLLDDQLRALARAGGDRWGPAGMAPLLALVLVGLGGSSLSMPVAGVPAMRARVAPEVAALR